MMSHVCVTLRMLPKAQRVAEQAQEPLTAPYTFDVAALGLDGAKRPTHERLRLEKRALTPLPPTRWPATRTRLLDEGGESDAA